MNTKIAKQGASHHWPEERWAITLFIMVPSLKKITNLKEVALLITVLHHCCIYKLINLCQRERERSKYPSTEDIKISGLSFDPIVFFLFHIFFSLSCVWVVPRITKIKILVPNTCWIHLYPYLFQTFVLCHF